MKKLLILLFSTLISLNSYGEWSYFSDNIDRHNFYISDDSINEIDGYVYFWTMENYKEPQSSYELLSVKRYKKGDCQLNQTSQLMWIGFKKLNGLEEVARLKVRESDLEWKYLAPGTINWDILNYVCDYVN